MSISPSGFHVKPGEQRHAAVKVCCSKPPVCDGRRVWEEGGSASPSERGSIQCLLDEQVHPHRNQMVASDAVFILPLRPDRESIQ